MTTGSRFFCLRSNSHTPVPKLRARDCRQLTPAMGQLLVAHAVTGLYYESTLASLLMPVQVDRRCEHVIYPGEETDGKFHNAEDR
jgi:hypothetical protein